MKDYNKNETHNFRRLFKEMITSEELETQEEVNQAYEAFVEDFSSVRDIKYYENAPKLTEKAIRKTKNNLVEKPILKSSLQKKNVLLSPKLYRKVMLANKQNIKSGFIVNQGEDKNILELSQIQLGYDKNNNPLCFLKLIRFKIDETLFVNKAVKNKIKAQIDNLLKQKTISKLQEIATLLDMCKKYSIQEYYLPEGFANKNCLHYASLLFRFERVYEKCVDPKDVVHHNYAMPNYFNNIYPEEVTSKILLREPHFHFLEGVSSISKQDDVVDKDNKLGAGYALPHCNVRGYLMKLVGENYKTEEDKTFFLTNDFGMPFLNLYKYNPEIVKEILEVLNSISLKDTPTQEVIKANNLVDLINNANIKINLTKGL